MQIGKSTSGFPLSVARSTYCLGVAYHYLKDFSHAKVLFQECMRIQVSQAGENDVRVVCTLCWIGRCAESTKEPAKALEHYLSALQICKKEKTSIDYRIVALLLHSIGRLYEDDKVNLEDMALKCKCEILIKNFASINDTHLTSIP